MPKGKNKAPKNKPKTKVRQRRSRLMDRARRDVMLSIQPLLDQINMLRQLAFQDYLGQNQFLQSTFGGLQEQLAGIQQPDFTGIGNTLTGQLGDLAGLFSAPPETINDIVVGMPGSEVQSAQAVATALGGSALDALATDAARFQNLQSSYQRQGALGESYARQNLTQDLQEMLRNMYLQQAQTMATVPESILARVDELRQQALENRLAQQKIASDRAFSEFLQNFLSGAYAPPGGGGGGGGGGRGGRFPPPTYTGPREGGGWTPQQQDRYSTPKHPYPSLYTGIREGGPYGYYDPFAYMQGNYYQPFDWYAFMQQQQPQSWSDWYDQWRYPNQYNPYGLYPGYYGGR